MGSPLSPLVANIFMEAFETEALENATMKPTHWFRFVDDTFVIWPNGQEELDKFLTYLNSLHENIQVHNGEREKRHSSLSGCSSDQEGGWQLGTHHIQENSHTNRYLHADSNHHPAVKKGILNSLVTRAEKICDTEHHAQEKRVLQSIFRENGYNSKFINKILQKKHKDTDDKKEETQFRKQVAILPYIEDVTDKISRELKK